MDNEALINHELGLSNDGAFILEFGFIMLWLELRPFETLQCQSELFSVKFFTQVHFDDSLDISTNWYAFLRIFKFNKHCPILNYW